MRERVITRAVVAVKLDRLITENRIAPCVFKATPQHGGSWSYSIDGGIETGGAMRFKSLQAVYDWLETFEVSKKG